MTVSKDDDCSGLCSRLRSPRAVCAASSASLVEGPLDTDMKGALHGSF